MQAKTAPTGSASPTPVSARRTVKLTNPVANGVSKVNSE